VKLRAQSVTILVAIGLLVIAAGSAAAYWKLRPEPMPPQVIYGSGRIEVDQVRVGVEVAGRLLENLAVEGQTLAAGSLLVRIDPRTMSSRRTGRRRNWSRPSRPSPNLTPRSALPAITR